MREPAHPWGTILHEVWEGDIAGRRGDIFSDDWASGRFYWSLRGVYRNLWGVFRSLWGEGRHGGRGACPGVGRGRWARAAQHPQAGDALDDQRDSPASVGWLDDALWQVYPANADLDGAGGRAVLGMGPGWRVFARLFFARNCSGVLRSAAPGPGVGTVRARAVGAVPGAGSGVPGAAAFSAGHRAGDLYAVGAAAGKLRQRVRPPDAKRRAHEFRGGFVVRIETRKQKLETRNWKLE